MNRYKLSVIFKMILSRFMQWVGPVKKELDFVRDRYHSIDDCKKIDYQTDAFHISGDHFPELKLPFGLVWKADWQFDSVKLTKQGFGDCNSIHRLYQVFWHNQKLESYLVSIFGDKAGHTVNIIKNGREYGLCDYSQTFFYPTYSDCIKKVSEKYPMVSPIKGIVIQDINWKIINRIE